MGNKKNVTGEKYHMLTITGDAPSKREPSGRLIKRVYTVCECGNTNESSYKNLKRGMIKSCGCYAKAFTEATKTHVNVGDIYTLWTVLEETEGYFKDGEKLGRKFLCQCVCGKEKEVHLDSLKSGKSKSCGCQGKVKEEKIIKEKIIPTNTEKEQWKESITYPGYYISTLGRLFNYRSQYMSPLKTAYTIRFDGIEKNFMIIKEMYKTFIGEYDEETHHVYLKSGEKIKIEALELRDIKIHRILNIKHKSMKVRCYNKNNPDYIKYGGRGIIIEDCFSDSDKFYKWAVNNGFEIGLEIDRKDNNGNYSVENCRWVTKAENTRNRRVSVLTWELVNKIRYGKWKELSNCEIAELLECNYSTIKNAREFKTWVK